MNRRGFLKATLGMALVAAVPLNIPMPSLPNITVVVDGVKPLPGVSADGFSPYGEYVRRMLADGLKVMRKYDGIPLFSRLATEGTPTGESIEVEITPHQGMEPCQDR